MNSARWAFAGAVLATAVTVVGTSQTVSACSCEAVGDRQAFAGADAVFTGELVDKYLPDPPGDVYSSDDPEVFVFEVDAVFKGDVSPTQEIITARDGASCGLEISGRGPFLVFAYSSEDSGGLGSGLCTNTRALTDQPVPPRWGTGQPPAPPTTLPPTVPETTPDPPPATTVPAVTVSDSDSGTSSTVIIGSVLAGAVVLGGAGLLLARRRTLAGS